MSEQENKKINKSSNRRLKRFLIAICLCVVSLVSGMVIGLKFDSKTTIADEVSEILKNEWMSSVYYEDVSDEDAIIAQFVSSIYNIDSSKQLDPYTYISKSTPSTPSSDGKMGVTFTSLYDYPVITHIENNSAAYEAGLKVNDIVYSLGKEIDGSIVTHYINESSYGFNSLLNFATGNVGDKIYVGVARFDENNNLFKPDIIEVTLKKSVASPYSYVEPCDIDDTLMVKITGFTELTGGNDTAGQLEQIFISNNESNDKKHNLIIDIRGNGGGDLTSLVNVCDLFLPKDKLVTTLELKDGTTIVKQTSNDEYYSFDKMVILMDGNTASASEILIGTLNHYFPDALQLVGTKSYGKGIAQRKKALSDPQYILQYTFARWLTPSGDCIHTIGFQPSSEQNTMNRNNTLSLMQSYSSYMIYQSDRLKLDTVSNINQVTARILNSKYFYSMRSDGYYDDEYESYIQQYKTLKNITNEIVDYVDEDTFFYFVNDYIQERNDYTNNFVLQAKTILGK